MNTLRVGIQGKSGSACDAVAEDLIRESDFELVYFSDAEGVLSNLKAGNIDLGVLAYESPLGTPVEETKQAINKYGQVQEIRELKSEVHHVLLASPDVETKSIRFVASHSIPLNKHREALSEYFPGYSEIETADTGIAAEDLASGKLPKNTAVIAMPHAGKIFDLKVLNLELPANDSYLTRFALVK